MKPILLGVVLATVVFATDVPAQRPPDTLARIKAAKVINVGFSGDSRPFSFVSDGNKPAGYSIDLCQRVIASIARTIGEPDLKINWVVGTVSERLQMVASGKLDMECANTTQTLSRMKDVDFSGLIFVDGGGFLVKTDSTVNRFTDLAGKKVAVIKGTTTEQRLQQAMKSKLVNFTVVTVRDGNEGVALLESGAVDAYSSDKLKLVGLAAQVKDPNSLALLSEDLSFEPYAFAVPRGDSSFRLAVNTALTQIYAGGEIERIFGQWLGKLGRPSGLLAAMYLLNSIPE